MKTWASRRYNDTCHIWEMWSLLNQTFKVGTDDGPQCPPIPRGDKMKVERWDDYGLGEERALKDYMNMINLKWENGPTPKLIHRRYFANGKEIEGIDVIPKHLRTIKRARQNYNPEYDTTLCLLINQGLFNSDDFAVTKVTKHRKA